MPIVSDHYTRLYKPEDVSPRNLPLSAALVRLADEMRVRWNRDGQWLQFRSRTYYHDRIKEVPNRLLDRWSAARRQHGVLHLGNLAEIAKLPDPQLDGAEMAEGARAIWGLAEWNLVRNGTLRPHGRFLAEFTPEQRQRMTTAAGLAFAAMTLSQQQGFMARALNQHPDDDRPLASLEELEGAAMRVEYTQPGSFQWRQPGEIGTAQWFRVLEPGPNGRRALMPPVRERTREAALQAVRRMLPNAEPAQIFPTELNLEILYFPGVSNRRLIHLVGPRMDVTPG
jgi:hypothetical protein